MNSRNLILVRHGQSEWNSKNLFTGWKDPGLTELGVKEAKDAGKLIANKGILFDLMYTSMLNKDDARKKWGDDQVHIWRRSFDIPPPDGESLKDTAERVLPYFKSEIMPKVIEGSSILIAAHGNSLRSLIMELDSISSEEIVNLEIPTGAPIQYIFNEDGSINKKIKLYEE